MLSYNVLNSWVEKMMKKSLPVKIKTSDITNLSTKDINKLKAGDIVLKKTGNQKHAYIVSYKEDNQGICLTYADATYAETVSYDYNTETKEWDYNSKDSTELVSKSYVDTLMSGALKRLIVETLPSENIDTNTIYMVLDSEASIQGNVYNEYLYINNSWELIGTTAVSSKYTHHVWCDFNVTFNNINYTIDFLFMVDSENSTAFDNTSLRSFISNLPLGSGARSPLLDFVGYVKTTTNIYPIARARKTSAENLVVEYIDASSPTDPIGITVAINSIQVYSDCVY